MSKTASSKQAFFEAVDSIASDFERRRVLSAVVKNADHDTVVAALDSASRMSSDFELASALISVAREHTIDNR